MKSLFHFFKNHGAWLGLFALTIPFAILTDGALLEPRNLTNILRQASINGVLAVGMTLVILTAGIDLSIGSIVAAVGVLVGISQVNWGWVELGWLGTFLSILFAIFSGGFFGSCTGFLVSGLGIPPFVITLGMMVILRGLALIWSGGSGISPMGEEFRWIGEAYLSTPITALILCVLLVSWFWVYRRKLADGLFLLITLLGLGVAFLFYKGFPVLALVLLLSLGLVAFILKYTTLGRSIYAVGSNEQAAFWAGVPVKKVKWFVYTAMGALSGLGAVLLTSRLNSAVPTAGQLFELDAIAAVVIGGTSLKGGSGNLLGTLVGTLMIAVLNNGMDLLQVTSFYQMVFKGLIIIAAVALDKGQRATV